MSGPRLRSLPSPDGDEGQPDPSDGPLPGEIIEPGAELLLLPAPTDPMAVARLLARQRYTDATTGELALHHWRGTWWEWQGSHWVEREERAVRKDAYNFTELAAYEYGSGL